MNVVQSEFCDIFVDFRQVACSVVRHF